MSFGLSQMALVAWVRVLPPFLAFFGINGVLADP